VVLGERLDAAGERGRVGRSVGNVPKQTTKYVLRRTAAGWRREKRGRFRRSSGLFGLEGEEKEVEGRERYGRDTVEKRVGSSRKRPQYDYKTIL
jgi:hypothetical protein